MIHDVANDLAIVIDYKRHWDAIGEGEDGGDKNSYFVRVGQIIEAAAGKEAFRYKTSPHSHHGHQRPWYGVRPD